MTSGKRDPDGPFAFLDRERILLLVLGLVLFLPGLGRHDLWNPDEPRTAEVSREMLASGDFLLPRLNGSLHTEPPPLHFWSICSSARLWGRLDEAAVRLPSALAAIATSLLVFSLGLRLYSSRAAWFAALVFMTNYKVLWQGRAGHVGLLLTLWTTLAIYAWVRGTVEDRPGLYLLFWVSAALGTLTRGLEGLLLPLLPIVVFLLLTRRYGGLRRLTLSPGVSIWLLVTLTWLIPAASAAGRSHFAELLLPESLRPLFAVGSGAGQAIGAKPWYYYLGTLPADFLPWSFLFPAAAWIAWNRARGEARQWTSLLMTWIVVILVFFSLSPVKRSVDVLPMFPALALLVGFGLDRAQEAWPRFRTAFAVPALLASLLIVAVGISVPLLRHRPELSDLDPALARSIAVISGLGALGVLLGSRFFWSGRYRRAVDSTAVGMGILILGAMLVVAPRLDSFKSARPLALQVLAHLGAEQTIVMYPRLEPGVLFYSQRLARLAATEEELQQLMHEDGAVLLVARRRTLAQLEDPPPLVEIYRDHVLRDGWSLLGPPAAFSATPRIEDPLSPPADREPDG